jgi:CRISPR system Cascade subunit CasB
MEKKEKYMLSDHDTNVIRQWWRALDSEKRGNPTIGLFKSLGKKELAELRRAENLTSVMLNRAYQYLAQLLPKYDKDGLALVAGMLAHVKTDAGDGLSMARCMGLPKADSNTSGVSQLRFERLQTAHDPDEFLSIAVRVIKMLNGTLDVCKLTDDVLVWADETINEQRPAKLANQLRVRWATDYYLASKRQESAVPSDITEEIITV